MKKGKKNTQHLLIIRFSAFGDVAMCLPVTKALLEQNPELKITFLSRKGFQGLFEKENLSFIGADFDQQHKGVFGLLRLFQQLRKEKITAVADLHSVLRSHLLTFFFYYFSRVKIAQLDKGRQEKKELIRKKNKVKSPLKTSIERYADVFRSLGFSLNLAQITLKTKAISSHPVRIGIAPFAQHKGKIYPLEKMKKVAVSLAEKGHSILLFGGGENEKKILENWESKDSNITSTLGKYSLQEELSLISDLHLMLSMDSANMHLASLKNTRVISIWGATHPYAGFLGMGQSMEDVISKDLTCSPCSIYGNTPCYKKEKKYDCLEIAPEEIIRKVEKILSHDK